MNKYPHRAKDGKWMVVLEIIDPKDNSMIGGTQFLFDSHRECISFVSYMSSPAGDRVRKEAMEWHRKILGFRTRYSR